MHSASLKLLCGALLGLPLSSVQAQSAVPAEAISFTTPSDAGASSSAVSNGTPTTLADLPDAPEAVLSGQAGNGGAPSTRPIAPKYTTSILPGQAAQPLSGGDKVVFAFRDAVSPFSFVGPIVSATYSQGVDSQPHYGQGWGPYGQRIGAAVARSTVQTLATEAVFAPIFRDDPRYYILGRQHKVLSRVLYAATRVVITRGDNGKNRLNAPLLLGYAAASGTNFAYYPQRDRNFGDAATGYAGSLGGAALGMEVNEFLDDALRIVHLRR